MNNDIKQVDISRWKQLGKGWNGAVFESLDDPDVVLKLDLKGRKDKMEHEFECAKRAAAMGIHTPGVLEFVSDGKSYGYTCQRIKGKKSYCRIIADDPSRLDEMAQRFAAHARELHSVECDKEFFESYEERSLEIIDKNKFLCPEIKSRVSELVKSIPPGTGCLLGDFHLGNIITDGNDDWWIDLERLCYGNPIYDFGMFYFTTHFMPSFLLKYLFHINKSQAKEFFSKAVEYYFRPKDKEELREIYYQLDKEVAVCYVGIIRSRLMKLIFLPKLKKHLKKRRTVRNLCRTVRA